MDADVPLGEVSREAFHTEQPVRMDTVKLLRVTDDRKYM